MTQHPTITLHGAWKGAVGDPTREFTGKVVASDHPNFAAGMDARVTYHTAEEKRPADAAEHGTYTLSVGGQSAKLMSFTCRSEATSGKQGTDDQQPADWQAVPLP